MLTFENDIVNEKLDVHANIEGLKYLCTILDSLIQQSEKHGNEHVHLMTQEWIGKDGSLSSDKQHPGNQLFNHVKIHCWHEMT